MPRGFETDCAARPASTFSAICLQAPFASMVVEPRFKSVLVMGGNLAAHKFDNIPRSVSVTSAIRALWVVHVFAQECFLLLGSPRFFAVLHIGAIKSPADAVRAAIVTEHRSRAEGMKQ